MMISAGALLAGASVVTACSAASAPRPPATPAVSGRADPSPGARLFSAAFKTAKLKGWTADRSVWRVDGSGIVTFTGTGAGQMLAPFSTARTHDFAVEATIEAVGPALHPDSGYGVEVRGAWPSHGIAAGSHLSTSPELNEPLLMWGRDSVGGADVALSPGYNTYRLEVHGKEYTLFVDGQRIVRFKIGTFSRGTRVGVWSMNQQVLVKSFTVTQLGSAKPLATLPAVEAVDLRPQDVPTSLTAGAGHFSTNQEVARLNKVPLTTLAGAGNIISYSTSYVAPSRPSFGPTWLAAYVFAFLSPDNAEADLTGRLTALQRTWSGNTNYAAGPVSALGDEGHALGYEYFAGDYDATAIGILFRRGRYEVVVVENFVQGGGFTRADLVAQTTALATIIDARARSQT
jgi:hypothetical protein